MIKIKHKKMNDLRKTFEHYYPDGAKGGQCAAFAEKLILMPTPKNLLGDAVTAKQAKVRKYGILASALNGEFKVGDVVIEINYGRYGHVCVISFIEGDYLHLTESNYRNDEIVHHNRIIKKTDPHIFGVIRGQLKVKIV